MGTKRLSRSIIEGGRTRGFGHDCRAAQGGFRAEARDYTQNLTSEAWEHRGEPRRRKVGVSQHDKLGAPRRWLRAQRGRRWDDVYADICMRFDTRTIAGQHIVFDHLLRDVDHGHGHDLYYRRYRRYVVCVDEQGIVRLPPPWKPQHRVLRFGDWTAPDLAAWLGERRVGRRGQHWYWFEPARIHREGGEIRYRQTRALDAKESRTFSSYAEERRAQLTLSFDEEGRIMPR